MVETTYAFGAYYGAILTLSEKLGFTIVNLDMNPEGDETQEFIGRAVALHAKLTQEGHEVHI